MGEKGPPVSGLITALRPSSTGASPAPGPPRECSEIDSPPAEHGPETAPDPDRGFAATLKGEYL
jgi:hypothetical protein